MPDWLRKLLIAQGSLGMVDSLSTLAGGAPEFAKMMDARRGQEQVAANFRDVNGVPTINLTPTFLQHFARQGMARPGYKAVDPNQSFGDYTLAHEFGHYIASGMAPNQSLGLAVADQAIATNKEDAADAFQQAFQFLRSGQGNMSQLSPEAQKLAQALLQQDLYRNHPLNLRVGAR